MYRRALLVLTFIVRAAEAIDYHPTQNRTGSLRVLSSEVKDGIVLLQLANASTRNIKTIVLRVGMLTIVRDLIGTGDVSIRPGDTLSIDVPLPQVANSAHDVAVIETAPIEIVAAFFSDKTAEGEQRTITTIEEQRRVRQIQLRNALARMESELEDSSNGPLINVSKLREKLSSLPSSASRSAPEEAVMKEANEFVTRQLERHAKFRSAQNESISRSDLQQITEDIRVLIGQL